MSNNMTWTNDKPTVPGLYWYRCEDCGEVLKTIISLRDPGVHEPWVSFAFSDRYQPLAELSGQFAGPIPEPQKEYYLLPKPSDETGGN